MDNGFTFGDRSTWDFSMSVERYPRQSAPARKMTTYTVAGRSGDLHAFEDAWENYIQRYEVYFRGEDPSPELAHAIKAWLFAPAGYQKLQDVYDPNHYRMAICRGPLDIENVLNRYGRCVLEFDCAPQSYLVEGDDPITFTAAGTLHNTTGFSSAPMIRIFGESAGTVTVGSRTAEIKAISGDIILDCQLMQAYSFDESGLPVNRNGNIYALEFPKLSPGENTVSFGGGITKIEITPRWWTL